jgi:hypothetical protein
MNHAQKEITLIDPVFRLEPKFEAHLKQVITVVSNFAHWCHLNIEGLSICKYSVQGYNAINILIVQVHYFMNLLTLKCHFHFLSFFFSIVFFFLNKDF